MAWRIAKHVVKGELDNRTKGLITGTLWLCGRATPIHLELRGNFLRDMAGCCLMFENRDPRDGDIGGMAAMQIGNTGDMTASRKMRVTEGLETGKSTTASSSTPFPRRTANGLYLEWFSETDGRVVIEATDFAVTLSEPAWVMTADEEKAQAAANREGFREWLEHLSELEALEEMPSTPETKPMNEFEWERVLKDSDRKNERLNEVLEKYHGHPDSEKLIAREMGWTWVEEELEAQERGIFIDAEEDGSIEEDEEEDDFLDDMRQPNPLREGIDWVQDADGSIEHPLALRALQFSAALWRQFEAEGLLEDTSDSRIFEWAGMIESMGVRLSNTLNDLVYDDEVDSGYVVAGLKRAVHLAHGALNMLQTVETLGILGREQLQEAQRTLFDLREDIIDMMRAYRARG